MHKFKLLMKVSEYLSCKARAERAPADTPSRKTTSRTPWAATAPAVSCKTATTRQRKFCTSSRAAWAFARAEKGHTPGLRPATPTAPKHAGTFTATCAPGLATFSPTSHSSSHGLLLTFVPPPEPLAMPLLFGMLTSTGTNLPTTTAWNMHSARSLLKPWGASKKKPNRGPRPTPTGLRPQHPERGGTEGGNAQQPETRATLVVRGFQ
jgi:hypothetical protein